ncbi:MAG: hypothetical protein ACUVQ8_07935, partial [Nitrososphaeria archaeon]
ILEKPMVVEKAADASLVGSGMLACFGAGWIKDLSKFDHLKYIQQRYEPRPQFRGRYRKIYELYKTLYMSLKDTFVAVSELQ